MTDVARVGVVGCGLMGSGIAEVCARAGRDVVVVEATRAAASAGRERIAGSLGRAVASGRLTAADRDAALGRISVTADPARLADRDLVVEAVAEDERAKLEVFALLDQVVERRDAVLATNTSSLPVIRLAAAVSRPEQVVGLHFFNPVPVLPLVELVPSLLTGTETVRRAHAFASEVLGKEVVRARDRAGFVVNALLVPYLLAAVRMAEHGRASAEDIDRGHDAGVCAPPGSARPGRPDRAGHGAGHRPVAVRGVPGAVVRAAAAAGPDGRRGAAGPQDGPGVPHLRGPRGRCDARG